MANGQNEQRHRVLLKDPKRAIICPDLFHSGYSEEKGKEENCPKKEMEEFE